MPNRILKDSICESDDINNLSWFEEVLFYRLIVSCDDFGRYDGRPAIIKNKLFPLRENLTVKAVKDGINKLARLNLVALYSVEGKPYLFLPAWNRHQRLRETKAKYPAPENADPDVLPHVAADCGELPQVAADCGLNPNPNPNTNTNTNICAEPMASAPPLPLNDGNEYRVTVEKYDEWVKLYPNVNVLQQLSNMRGWLLENPNRRKTPSGIGRFIVNWLAKEQDRGTQNRVKQTHTVTTDTSHPAAYDIERAQRKMDLTVPKYEKRGKK